MTRSRNKEDERVLDVAPTARAMTLKLDGQRAAVAIAEASGESLEGVLELQQRLTRMRENVAKATKEAA